MIKVKQHRIFLKTCYCLRLYVYKFFAHAPIRGVKFNSWSLIELIVLLRYFLRYI
jgi:hypothetical protein